MTTRRRFLTTMIAAGALPHTGWADAGDPSYLSAAKLPSGSFALLGLDQRGGTVFTVPLPGRGHAAAAHPTRPVAVAFARRPGLFAVVIDCLSGTETIRLAAPAGHHFYGHGTYSADGTILFTTENDYERARGIIGLWDVENGYRRIGSFASGGVGPHDLRLMPDGQTLVVANGGIETHPASGRTKLNLGEMRPNLSYLSTDGTLLARHEPEVSLRKNSIRHLAVRSDGLVAVACQWQGDPAAAPPLLATHRFGEPLKLHRTGLEIDLSGYLGSIAFSGAGDAIAVTGPRGNMAAIIGNNGNLQRTILAQDVCGVAGHTSGFLFTTGRGKVLGESVQSPLGSSAHNCQWDNHLIPVHPSQVSEL